MPTAYFICEGNRFRSQIAEALFNAWAPPGWTAASGGTNPRDSVAQGALDLLAEIGIDWSGHRPKPIDVDVAGHAARVIAMCSLDTCPAGVREVAEHWGVPDPKDVPPDRVFEIRDEIAERVKALIREIARTPPRAKG